MLKIHFLNVGHGDCCILEFDTDRTAIVDINCSDSLDEESTKEILQEYSYFNDSKINKLLNSSSDNIRLLKENAGYDIDLTDPIEYLYDNDINKIFRFISTHPHMDHLSGLSYLNEKFTISNVWITDNEFTQNEDELNDSQKEDWDLYKEYRNNIFEEKVDGAKVLSLKTEAEGEYYTEDGINILAPNDDLIDVSDDKDNKNIMSTVLFIEYGECKIMLTGDATEETWDFIADNFFEEIKNIDILGAAHHGRETGYHQKSVKQMSPKHTVVSVGKKPDTDASGNYANYSENVYSTRWKGNITFKCYESGNVYPEFQYDR